MSDSTANYSGRQEDHLVFTVLIGPRACLKIS